MCTTDASRSALKVRMVSPVLVLVPEYTTVRELENCLHLLHCREITAIQQDTDMLQPDGLIDYLHRRRVTS